MSLPHSIAQRIAGRSYPPGALIGAPDLDAGTEHMTAGVQSVTPDLARHWLDLLHPNQRPPIWSRIRRYATQMTRGDWRVTHEGAAFDVDDFLIDGQNRLHAVILADRPIAMLVFRGLPRGSYEHIGQGLPRRLEHIIALDWVTARTVAAGRAAMGGPLPPTATSARPTPEQEAAFILANEAALRAAREWVPRIVAPVAGVLARAYYHVPHATLARFGDVIVSGITSGAHEAAAVRLRDWLHEHTSGGAEWRGRAYQLTQQAVRLFRANDGVARLAPVTDDVFPLPEDKRLDAL